jgi:hypothetical protein
MNEPENTVEVDDLRRYLLRRGWARMQHPNDRIEMFRTPADSTGDFSTLALPTNPDYKDAASLILEAIRLVSDHERTPFARLLEKVRNWDLDILRARTFLITGSEDSLPFEVAAETISSLKDFMGYAAYTEFNPQPFFDKAGNVSSDFTKHCRFGHTFRGSFGMTIECPITITPVLPMPGNEPVAPFERKVFERVASGLTALRKAVRTENVEGMISGYQKGFSANMCRALAEVFEKADGRRIEYDFSWSTELATPAEVGWQPFVFEGRAYEFARAAATELERVEKFPDSVVEGRIVVLRSETPPGLDQQQEFEHVITMFWEREKDQPVRIRVPLSPSQYMDACIAHRDGRAIRIFGVPEKQGKFWVLTKPHDFTILPAGGT